MRRRTMLQTILAAGAGSASFLSGRKLQAAQPEFTLRSDVRLVLLDVAVRDRKGSLVSDLSKENFTVSENGKRQQISVFAHEDLPITVGLLMDESYSMKPRRTQVLTAAEIFIAESNSHDEVFVLNFNDRVSYGLPPNTPFSDNRQLLRAALQRGVPQGKTALNDAIGLGLRQLESGHRARKALVLISDGGDTASERTRREILNLVEKSSATIYTVGIYDEGDPDRDPAFLSTLASITGGESYFPQQPSEVSEICSHIARDIRSRYTVGYVPLLADSNALRRVHVQVAGTDGRMTATTRKSYIYDDKHS